MSFTYFTSWDSPSRDEWAIYLITGTPGNTHTIVVSGKVIVQQIVWIYELMNDQFVSKTIHVGTLWDMSLLSVYCISSHLLIVLITINIFNTIPYHLFRDTSGLEDWATKPPRTLPSWPLGHFLVCIIFLGII